MTRENKIFSHYPSANWSSVGQIFRKMNRRLLDCQMSH